MKKFLEWFKKDDTMVLKVIPCCWAFALLIGGADLFKEGISINSILMFALYLFLGLVFWGVFVALPWTIQDKKFQSTLPVRGATAKQHKGTGMFCDKCAIS